MTIAEFIEVTGELESFFGDKEYNETQRRYIYETFKGITKERYRQVIRKAIRTSKFMPKLADLIEIESNLPNENARTSEKVECNICGGTGMIPYTRYMQDGNVQRQYTNVARCICANANGISKSIPLASEVGILGGNK